MENQLIFIIGSLFNVEMDKSVNIYYWLLIECRNG